MRSRGGGPWQRALSSPAQVAPYQTQTQVKSTEQAPTSHSGSKDAPSFSPFIAELPSQIKALLSELDNRLAGVLKSGDIRLIRTEWLLAQPLDYRMQCRQDLEERERKGESPLLKEQEAVDLLRSGTRAIGVLSYGWLAAGLCDPVGERVSTLRNTLKLQTHITAIFWE